ncbi:MAG: preprotein translocase subunit YajC [Phycisphaerae bacterium]
MTDFLMMLAQATTQPGGQPPQADSFMRFLFPLLLAMGVFYILMFRGQRKDRQKHADMLKNLKRNDRVQTVGGVLGTVVDVRENENEVVLKVDETNNVKMRFNRTAIKEVLSGAAEGK